MTKMQSIRKSNFEKTLGNTEKDFLLYCAVQLYYSEPITLRKLENHFTNETINKALATNVIKPWKDVYWFSAYQYTTTVYDLPKLIDEANKKGE